MTPAAVIAASMIQWRPVMAETLSLNRSGRNAADAANRTHIAVQTPIRSLENGRQVRIRFPSPITPADSTAIPVTGITPILPRAGDMLSLPQAETDKHNALLGLLEQLEGLEMMDRVSAIHLESTQVQLRYLERFDVKIC